ncbi:glycosyltransferase, partial [Burkholderia cenocepacia]|uniref:glycosyltransferase n=5 Tax=Bacteria TaxID=2 RepID=UPI002231981A
FKGSKYLERTIDRLKLQGYDIEYCKVQGVPNSQVIELFAQSDIVADQFIGGAYGYTALEAMALGKPVLSFVRSPDLVEAPEECPIINATPDELEQALLWILRNRERLRRIGEQGRRYVERWHGISAIAARLGQLYRETANFPPNVVDRIRIAQD